MVLLQIPASSTHGWYTQNISLSGVSYVLDIRYNTRMDRWLLGIYDAGQNPILLGLPLLINRNLTSQYQTLSVPEGALFVLDKSGNELQAGLTSFNLNHVLVYADPTQ